MKAKILTYFQIYVSVPLIKDEKVAKKKLEKRQGKSKTCNTTRSVCKW